VYYDHWESSVEDYGYYQATSGLIKARSDQEYYNLLSQMGYAEDPNYILKVKKLAEELKDKF
jgi:flagellum-specific peptidoglycan hydrolase FlgJ